MFAIFLFFVFDIYIIFFLKNWDDSCNKKNTVTLMMEEKIPPITEEASNHPLVGPGFFLLFLMVSSYDARVEWHVVKKRREDRREFFSRAAERNSATYRVVQPA